MPAVLSLGVVGQIGQIVLLRELLMVFHGSELSLGIILSAWMVWVGIGSRLGAFLAGRLRRPRILLAAAAAALPPTLTGTLILIRVLRGFFPVPAGAYLSIPDMAAACLAVMAPVGLLLGAQFVLLAREWRESDGVADASPAGRTYIWEAAGNVVGGVLFTLVAVHLLDPFQTAVAAGMLVLVAVLALDRLRAPAERLPARLRPALAAFLLVPAAALPLLGTLDAWASRLQWRLLAPEYRLVETRRSRYGAVSVLERDDQLSFFQSGHLLFSAAGPEASAAALEEQEGVVFAHFSMVQHPDPRRVLLIGGGLRGTLREIARHPVERIDYVELDRVLIEAARAHLPAANLRVLEDPRVRLIHTDGRLFVKTAVETYDLIIVDVPDPSTAVLNRFYTEEFFREAAARLVPGGVFVIGAASTPDMRGAAVANRNAAIYHTLRRVFPRVLPAGERFLYFFAVRAPGRLTADAGLLQARYLERGIEAAGFSHRHFPMLLQEGPLLRINWVIRNHGRRRDAHLGPPEAAPLFPASIAEQEAEEERLPPVRGRAFINSDFQPIGYYWTLLFWSALARADHGGALRWIARVEPWWIAPAVGVLLAAALLLRVDGRRRGGRADIRFAVLLAVFTTGLSTMAMQVALLFTFQSLYGFVYEMVGLIVAVFMAGLALGAALSHRFVADKSRLDTLAAVQFLIAVFAGAIGLALPAGAALPSPVGAFLLIAAITFASGLLNGLDFPLAAACCLELSRSPEKAAGTVYGVELFGACAGALLAGVVVAPVLGIVACCLLAGAANAAAFLTLMVSRRS